MSIARKPNKNKPSKIYWQNLHFWTVFEQDTRYCGGHRSHGKDHKILSRMLRAKLKELTVKEINNGL